MALSTRAMGKALGVSAMMVSKDSNRGMPMDSVEAAKEWRKQNVNPARAKSSMMSSRTPTEPTASQHRVGDFVAPHEVDETNEADDFFKHRSRREDAEAQIAQIKLQEMRGDLVRAADVKTEMASKIIALRETLLSIAARLTPLLANESDPLKVHKTIDDEMRRALAFIAGSEVSEATL